MKHTALIVLPLLLGGLAACGDDSGTSGAPAEYEPLTTADFAEEMTDAMLDAETFHLSVSMDGENIEMDMRVGEDADDLAFVGTFGSDEMIYIDGDVYMREKGETKYELLPAQVSRLMTASLGDMSPAGQIETFEKVVDEIEYVGTRKVDGETLRLYDLEVDPKELAKQADAPPGTKFPGLDYDLFLDDQHRMREIRVKVGGQKFAFQIDGWGKDLEIEAPPSSQLKPLS